MGDIIQMECATASCFRDLINLEIIEHSDDLAVFALTISAGHLNSQGYLHGGVVATMIDHAGGVAGCFNKTPDERKKAVTLSLTTSFLAPAKSGRITATARKRSGGKKIFASTTEVCDESGKLIAIGESTYRYINPASINRVEG